MKTYILVVVIQAIEVAAFVFVPYGAGCLFFWLTGEPPLHPCLIWLVGAVFTFLAVCIGMLVCIVGYIILPGLISDIIKLNWQWAKKLTRRDDD